MCPLVAYREPLSTFSHIILENFTEMCRSAPFVFKIRQKQQTLYLKTHFCATCLGCKSEKYFEHVRQKKIKYAVVYPMHCSLAVCPTIFETSTRKRANSSEMLRYEHIPQLKQDSHLSENFDTVQSCRMKASLSGTRINSL